MTTEYKAPDISSPAILEMPMTKLNNKYSLHKTLRQTYYNHKKIRKYRPQNGIYDAVQYMYNPTIAIAPNMQHKYSIVLAQKILSLEESDYEYIYFNPSILNSLLEEAADSYRANDDYMVHSSWSAIKGYKCKKTLATRLININARPILFFNSHNPDFFIKIMNYIHAYILSETNYKQDINYVYRSQPGYNFNALDLLSLSLSDHCYKLARHIFLDIQERSTHLKSMLDDLSTNANFLKFCGPLLKECNIELSTLIEAIKLIEIKCIVEATLKPYTVLPCRSRPAKLHSGYKLINKLEHAKYAITAKNKKNITSDIKNIITKNFKHTAIQDQHSIEQEYHGRIK